MGTAASIRQQLIKAINELPADALPELANFIEYLRVKINRPGLPPEGETQADSGSAFLLSIAELGVADEDNLSERDEEILAGEIDPIRGWGLSQDKPQ